MRHWDDAQKEAKSVQDLARLMADWLEGRIAGEPDACGELDPETTPLIRTLAAINRGGFLTECSQPGEHGRYDGRILTQLPFVSGFVSRSNRPLVDALQRKGRAANLVVIIDGQRDDGRAGGVPVTFVDREVEMHTGGATPDSHLRYVWSGLPSLAFADLMASHQVTLIDLKGKRRTRLWDVVLDVTAQFGGH